MADKFACSRARQLISVHLAHNFEALLEAGALWALPPSVWEETLRRDCLAVRGM